MNIEDHVIDVRDIDPYRWCEGVRAFLDRSTNDYFFPLESIERLGEPDEDDSGSYWLLDGAVEAEAAEIEIAGQPVPVWRVPVGMIVTRPAAPK